MNLTPYDPNRSTIDSDAVMVQALTPTSDGKIERNQQQQQVQQQQQQLPPLPPTNAHDKTPPKSRSSKPSKKTSPKARTKHHPERKASSGKGSSSVSLAQMQTSLSPVSSSSKKSSTVAVAAAAATVSAVSKKTPSTESATEATTPSSSNASNASNTTTSTTKTTKRKTPKRAKSDFIRSSSSSSKRSAAKPRNSDTTDSTKTDAAVAAATAITSGSIWDDEQDDDGTAPPPLIPISPEDHHADEQKKKKKKKKDKSKVRRSASASLRSARTVDSFTTTTTTTKHDDAPVNDNTASSSHSRMTSSINAATTSRKPHRSNKPPRDNPPTPARKAPESPTASEAIENRQPQQQQRQQQATTTVIQPSTSPDSASASATTTTTRSSSSNATTIKTTRTQSALDKSIVSHNPTHDDAATVSSYVTNGTRTSSSKRRTKTRNPPQKSFSSQPLVASFGSRFVRKTYSSGSSKTKQSDHNEDDPTISSDDRSKKDGKGKLFSMSTIRKSFSFTKGRKPETSSLSSSSSHSRSALESWIKTTPKSSSTHSRTQHTGGTLSTMGTDQSDSNCDADQHQPLGRFIEEDESCDSSLSPQHQQQHRGSVSPTDLPPSPLLNHLDRCRDRGDPEEDETIVSDTPLKMPLRRCRSSSSRQVHTVANCKRSVSFGHVLVREYERSIGDSPAVSSGPPIGLNWSYYAAQEYEVDVFESCLRLPGPRTRRDFFLSPQKRFHMLLDEWGFSVQDICRAKDEAAEIRHQRQIAAATPSLQQQSRSTNSRRDVPPTTRNRSVDSHIDMDDDNMRQVAAASSNQGQDRWNPCPAPLPA